MGTNCAPLIADFFLFCNERDFMVSLSDDTQADRRNRTDIRLIQIRAQDTVLNIVDVRSIAIP